MARKQRQWIEGATYHLFARGSNRQAIFLNEADLIEFELIFGDGMRAFELDCFGWSFMTNHWHALVRCPEDGLSRFVQRMNQRYALRFDKRWGRTAHVFENRFGAVIQESEEQLLWTLRYVVRNPVDAGLCSSPLDTRWTSFAATAGLVPAPDFLRVSEVLSYFAEDPIAAKQRYIDFVVGIPEQSNSALAGLRSGPVPLPT